MAASCCHPAGEERARFEGREAPSLIIPLGHTAGGAAVAPEPLIPANLNKIKGEEIHEAVKEKTTASCPWLPRFSIKTERQTYEGVLNGMPKELLLILYMLSAVLTTCVYFGFPALRRMLLASGAYSWLCTDTAIAADAAAAAAAGEGGEEHADDEGRVLCNAQDAAVAPLFTMAMVSHSLMSAVAGTLLDHFGPKLTALIGQGLNIIGWLLLATSWEGFPAYIPALICIGLGADTCYLPLLKIVNLFQKRSGAIISLLGVACTASFGMPVVLEMIWKSQPAWRFSHVCGVYMLMGPGVSIPIALFFIPWKSFAVSKEEETEKRPSSSLTGEEASLSTAQPPCPSASASGSSLPVSLITTSTSRAEGDAMGLQQEGLLATSPSPPAAMPIVLPATAADQPPDADSDPDPDPDPAVGDATTAPNTPTTAADTLATTAAADTPATTAAADAVAACSAGEKHADLMDLSCLLREKAETQRPSSKSSDRNSSRELSNSRVFFSEVLSIRFLCIPLFASSQQLAISYFQVAAPRLLERRVASQMDKFLSLAFIPCILIGTASDYFGIFRVLFFVNTLGLFAYAFTLGAPAYTPHLVSLVCFCGYVALDSELVFCCVNKMFSSNNFGKLSGIAQATGGLVSLISIPLYNSISVRQYGGNCKPVVWGLAVTLACIYPLLGLVWWLQSKSVTREDSCSTAVEAGAGALPPQAERKKNKKVTKNLVEICTDTPIDEKTERELQDIGDTRRPLDAAA